MNKSAAKKMKQRSAGKPDIELGKRIRLRRDNKSREVESLLFLDSAFSLRLLRAYSKIKDQTVQRQLVSLMESIAANEE